MEEHPGLREWVVVVMDRSELGEPAVLELMRDSRRTRTHRLLGSSEEIFFFISGFLPSLFGGDFSILGGIFDFGITDFF